MVSRAHLDIAARIAAAGPGGFALAYAAAALGAWLLPLDRAEAVTWATIAAFPIQFAAILWAFAARSAGRAWLGLALPAALCLVGLVLVA